MKENLPNYIICLQRPKPRHIAIVFRRNNLSVDRFVKDSDTGYYSYNEVYRNSKFEISFTITVKSDDFSDIFSDNCHYFTAYGKSNSFDVTIRTKARLTSDVNLMRMNKILNESGKYVKYKCTLSGRFESYRLYDKNWNKISDEDKLAYLNLESIIKTDRSNNIIGIPIENVHSSIQIDSEQVKRCPYYRNALCMYLNNQCNPRAIGCKGIYYTSVTRTDTKRDNEKQILPSTLAQITKTKRLSTVILSYNRKCINENHSILDIKVKISVLLYINNKIIDEYVQAGYCPTCNQYIILKSDFIKIKQKGVLLCEIIDKTPDHVQNSKWKYSGAESRIHALGYNVVDKKGYTSEQRKIILANIMENYDIKKHEILSMIDLNISRKRAQKNYQKAVQKWKEDREFVIGYEHGDIPEVIIDRITIGRR